MIVVLAAGLVALLQLVLVRGWGHRPRRARAVADPRPAGTRVRTRLTPWRVAVTVGYAAMAFSIGLRLLDYSVFVYGGNDLLPHSGFVDDLSFHPLYIPQPHFLLHVLARLVMVSTGSHDADLAVEIVVTALAALGALLLSGYMERRSRSVMWAVLGTVVVLAGETPYVFIEAPSEIRLRTGYVVLHLWATPTNAFFLPVALLLMPRLLGHRSTTTRTGIGLAALVALAMVAKPNAPLVLVPAAFVVAVLSARGWPSLVARGRFLVLYALVPMAVVGWLQFRFVSNLDPVNNGGFRIAPLHEMELAGLVRPIAWLGMAIPFAFLLLAGGRWWRNASVQFGLAAVAIGVTQFALLGETGYRANHANWAVSSYVGYLVLVIVAVGYLLERVSEPAPLGPGPVPRRAAGAFVGLLLLAGAFAWADSVGLWL